MISFENWLIRDGMHFAPHILLIIIDKVENYQKSPSVQKPVAKLDDEK